jgi:hypothetical protein
MVRSADPRAHLLEGVYDGRARELFGAVGGDEGARRPKVVDELLRDAAAAAVMRDLHPLATLEVVPPLRPLERLGPASAVNRYVPSSCTVLRITLLSFSAVPVGLYSWPAGAEDLATDASIVAATCAMLSTSTPCRFGKRPTNSS